MMSPKAINCLVVESDALRSKQVIEALGSSSTIHYHCSEASSVEEAKSALREGARYELVISRGIMPKCRHVELLETLRAEDGSRLVVCLLEDEQKSVILDTGSEAADDYLFYKDFSAERLLESLQIALDRKTLLHELKSMQSTSSEGKAVYRGLLHHLDVAMFLVSRPDGELIFHNKVAEAWLSGNINECLSELFEYGIFETDSTELEVAVGIANVPHAELRAVQVEWKGQDCCLVTLRNISRRKRAEAAYQSSQRRLELALKASNIGLWSWDISSGQVHFSERWKKQIGLGGSASPNTYEAFLELVHEDERQDVAKSFEMASSGACCDVELRYRLRIKSGEFRWFLCRAEMFAGDGKSGPTLLGTQICLKVDPVKSTPAVAREARSLKDKLGSRLERMVENVESLAAELKDSFRSDSLILERIQEVERLSKGISTLHQFVRSGGETATSQPESMELGNEVQQLYLGLQSLLPRSARLEFERESALLLKGIDRESLHLLLTEALICVGSKVSREFRSAIKVVLRDRARRLSYSELPALELIFSGEPLVATEIQELSKIPEIDVTSESVGERSRLKISFHSSLVQEPEYPALRSSKLALLAEDEGVLRMAIRTMLEGLGFEVEVAQNGTEAIDAFSRRSRDFDLALVDMQMPEVDGAAVVESLWASRGDLPIIRMSGDDSGFPAPVLVGEGQGTLFLPKPFGVSQLKAAIEQLQAGARLV